MKRIRTDVLACGVMLLAMLAVQGTVRAEDEGAKTVRGSAAVNVEKIKEKYKEMPGGYTLEGTAQGLPKVTKAVWDKEADQLILNDSGKYQPGIDAKEFKEVFRAIADDDLMGVSVAAHGLLTYGKLKASSKVARNLRDADELVRDIVFGYVEDLRGVEFPKGWKPAQTKHPEFAMVAYTNMDSFWFAKKDGAYVHKSARLDVQVIPVSESKSEDGGWEADQEILRKGLVPKQYLGNARHVMSNLKHYEAKVESVRYAVNYGFAAALARKLKADGIDIKKLADEIK